MNNPEYQPFNVNDISGIDPLTLDPQTLASNLSSAMQRIQTVEARLGGIRSTQSAIATQAVKNYITNQFSSTVAPGIAQLSSPQVLTASVPSSWTTSANLQTYGVPANATAVCLIGTTGSSTTIYTRQDISQGAATLSMGPGSITGNTSGYLIQSLSSSGTIDYLRSGSGTATITIIGYVVALGSIATSGGGSGSGTVTSVDLAAPAQFIVSGNPIIGAGTISLSWATVASGTALMGPASGAATVPSFRRIQATDIPLLDASIITSGQIALARGGSNADLSATGPGYVKQATLGANFTVSAIASADLPAVSVSAQGACPTLPNDSTKYLNGVGAWAVPAGGSMTNPMTNVGDLIYGGVAGAPTRLADVATGSYLASGGINTAPAWATLNTSAVGLGNVTNDAQIKASLGTNVGDLISFSSASTPSRIADVATGSYLASGGVNTQPLWATLNQAAVAGLTTADSPTHVGLTLSGLTASVPVVSNGSKALASVTYATFLASLGIAAAGTAGKMLYDNASSWVASAAGADKNTIRFAGTVPTPNSTLTNDGNGVAVNMGATGTVGLTINGIGSQTADMISAFDSSAQKRFSVAAGGATSAWTDGGRNGFTSSSYSSTPTDSSYISMAHYRGSMATPTASQANDNLAQILGGGHDGTNGGVGGTNAFNAEETWTTSAHGTQFVVGLRAKGSLTNTNRLLISANGNTVTNANQAALATNATDGFLYIPTCAGTPTGVPTAYTGNVAMIYDTTNNHMYIYNAGWKMQSGGFTGSTTGRSATNGIVQ